jgi:hypothetical protein
VLNGQVRLHSDQVQAFPGWSLLATPLIAYRHLARPQAEIDEMNAYAQRLLFLLAFLASLNE